LYSYLHDFLLIMTITYIINKKVIINMGVFSSYKEFEDFLLNLFNDFCNQSEYKDCKFILLKLKLSLSKNINYELVYLYPYVDKSTSFKSLYDAYINNTNNSSLRLTIKEISLREE